VLIILKPSYSDCLKVWETELDENFEASPGVYGDCFTFTFTSVCVRGTSIDNLDRILKEAAVS
jgi:hypothetical protein